EAGFVEVRRTRPGARSGYLLFCQFDGHGAFLEPRRGGAHLAASRHGAALRRLLDRLGATADVEAEAPEGPVYQFQLFVESYAPLTPAEQAEARALCRPGVA